MPASKHFKVQFTFLFWAKIYEKSSWIHAFALADKFKGIMLLPEICKGINDAGHNTYFYIQQKSVDPL